MSAFPSAVTIVSDTDPIRRRRVARVFDTRSDGYVVENDLYRDPFEIAAFVHCCDADTVPEAAPLGQIRELLEAGCTSLCVGHVVSVVDSEVLWAALNGDAELAGPEQGVTFLERAIEQIEWRTVVVFAGRLSPDDQSARAVVALVMLLNPSASLLSLDDLECGEVTAPRLQVDAMAHVRRAPGWIGELNGRRALSFSLDTPMRAVVFCDPRPFHPVRLAAALARMPEGIGPVLRSRGFVTLASRPARPLSWSSAGGVLGISPVSTSVDARELVTGQELVFYGLGLETEAVFRTLAECLLTPAELLLGPAAWRRFADPFPG